MQVLNSNAALQSFSMYCRQTTLYWVTFTDQPMVTPWQMQHVQIVSSTNSAKNVKAEALSNKHRNWPWYLYKLWCMSLSRSMIVNYESLPTSCRRKYWVFTFCWTKKGSGLVSQSTEDLNKSHSQALGNLSLSLSLCWRVLYEPQRFYKTVGGLWDRTQMCRSDHTWYKPLEHPQVLYQP